VFVERQQIDGITRGGRRNGRYPTLAAHPAAAPRPYPGSFDANEVAPPEGETSEDPHYGWCNACRTAGRATGYKAAA
jgi:hypothetical protein